MATCPKCRAPIAYEGAKCGACVARKLALQRPRTDAASGVDSARPCPAWSLDPAWFCFNCGIRLEPGRTLCGSCYRQQVREFSTRRRRRRELRIILTVSAALIGCLFVISGGVYLHEVRKPRYHGVLDQMARDRDRDDTPLTPMFCPRFLVHSEG